MSDNLVDLIASFQSNMPWLGDRIMFLTKHGSQAYGTNLPDSDTDYKGFCLPPKEYLLGFYKIFEQAEAKDPCDLVIYSLNKFAKLAADCNPSIIEVMWTDPSDWKVCSVLGEEILDKRDLFISKKARYTFSGYAIAQLKRIQTHYKWLKSPPLSPPNRIDYGLPENTVIPKDQLAAAQSAIQKKMDSWSPDFTGVDDALRIKIMGQFNDTLVECAAVSNMKSEDIQWRVATELMGYDQNFIDLLDRERRYRSTLNNWNSYQTWKETRNPARAAIEERYGYDCKHGMHLVRLLNMCKEILTTGKVIVKRPDRELLLSIRNGAWTYEQLIEWAAAQDKEMDDIYKTSPLRREPDRAAIDKLIINIAEKSIC